MKDFPDWFLDKADWQEKNFDDVIIPKARIGWQNLRKDEYEKNSYAYLISGTDFKNGTVSTENIWQISKERYEMDKNIQVSAGDVLVTKDGTIGKVAIVPEFDKPATLNSGVYVFRTEKNLIPQFLFYILQSQIFKNFIHILQAGTTINHLYQKDLQNFKFKIPPLDEQKKIADYFTHLDNAIKAQDLKLKSWRDAKKAMLQKIFSQEFYFTQDSGEKYPAWQEKTLAEVCAEFQSGKNITADKIFENEKYPVYGGNGLRGYTDKFNREGIFAVIGRQGALCGNIHFVEGKIYFTEHAIVVRANEENSTRFLSYILETMNLNQYSGQTAQPGLAVNKLIGLKNKFPCIEEQKKIADYFSSLDKIIDAENKMLESLRQMKRGLLQKLFV